MDRKYDNDNEFSKIVDSVAKSEIWPEETISYIKSLGADNFGITLSSDSTITESQSIGTTNDNIGQ